MKPETKRNKKKKNEKSGKCPLRGSRCSIQSYNYKQDCGRSWLDWLVFEKGDNLGKIPGAQANA